MRIRAIILAAAVILVLAGLALHTVTRAARSTPRPLLPLFQSSICLPVVMKDHPWHGVFLPIVMKEHPRHGVFLPIVLRSY